VVGGLRVYEPAADLAIAAAIASSLAGVAVPADTVLLGEIGLSGELRTVSQLDRRLAEAGKLGFRRAVVPGASTGRRAGGRSDDENGIATAPARTLRHALETVLGGDALPTGRRLAPEA
jgi:DNA repair protein RadA/Sms